jgi:uncharacterized protein (TIGR03118 family)
MHSGLASYRNWALAACVTSLLLSTVPAASAGLVQTNLVSNIPGLAAVTDPLLVNPWGMAASATSPWWVADNGTGVSTLYNGNTGAPSALVVTIPPSPSAPTGLVFNNTPGFILPVGGTKASFIFATEDGTIAGWNGAQGTQAVTMATLADSSFKAVSVRRIISTPPTLPTAPFRCLTPPSRT